MDWLTIMVPVFTTVLGAVLAYYLSQRETRKKIADSEAKKEAAQRKLDIQKKQSFYELLNVHLQASYDAFTDQCRIRDKLLRLLGFDLNHFDWEKLEEVIADAYLNFTDEQRNLFDLIRSITENSLYTRNNEVLKLLMEKSEYFNELKEFKELQGHLELWNSKFNSFLKTRQDYCLIYVGVKEDKPFPTGIEDKVLKKIEELKMIK